MRWVTLFLLAAVCADGLALTEKVCDSVDVRNTPAGLKALHNCTAVEGSVQIVLIENATEKDFAPWSFPELREITEYLLLFRVKGLRSVGKLFPNLARIGGNSLMINYGLVIHEMAHLQEVGLSNLKEISRGSVIILKNPSLCFVNTIKWDYIAKWGPVKNYVALNKPPETCPHPFCNETVICKENLCWNANECQIKQEQNGCDPLCVGGCSGPGPSGCYSCRRVITPDRRCVQTCPKGLYEYRNRRCITQADCTALKWFFVYNGTCTDSCPPGYGLIMNGSGCEPCYDKCRKPCMGASIDNIGTAQAFRGCTHIVGSLEISIKTGKPKVIAQELEENLGSIEEIEGYLKIARSVPITDLNFLKNLTVIRGQTNDTGYGERHSLIVLENQNLQELWDWNVKKHLKILKGNVFFHYNPKLCLQHIYKLQNISGIHWDNNNGSIDISKHSNGDKYPCNPTEFNVTVTYVSSSSIELAIPHLKINYDATILRYVVYFIKDVFKNITIFDDFDQCSENGWKLNDISVDRHDQHFLNNGLRVNITNLEPHTQYGFYVTMYTVDLFGAKSALCYETTLPARPTELSRLGAVSNKTSEIHVYWEPPKVINGNMKEYVLTWIPLEYNVSLIRMRNYCEYPLTYTSEIDAFKSELPVRPTFGKDCCPNSRRSVTSHRFKDNSDNLCSHYDHCPYTFSDKESPLSRDACIYSYLYDHPFTNTSFLYKVKTDKKNNRNSNGIKLVTHHLPGNSTEFIIKRLMHFTDYVVTVRACREVHPDERDKSIESRCSRTDIVIVKTQSDVNADKIPGPVTYKTVNGTVIISWDSPFNPNGLVVAFEIEYQHLDAGNPIITCLPYSEYVSNKGRFEIVGLGPGKYEVRVRTVSLAGIGQFSEYIYFTVGSRLFSITYILLFVTLLCIVIVFITISVSTFKKKYQLEVLVATVNPDYQYLPDCWEVPAEDVEIINELGAGSFGKVYEGKLKTLNISCAIKTVSDQSTDYDRLVFLSEASIMKLVSDAYHIVKLLGVVSTVQPPLVIMELMSLGDLKTYLRSTRESQPPSIAVTINMALQICDGMAYLEAKKYVHRDLAARNCMVNKDCVVKVGDFGMTRDIYETDYYRKNNTGPLPIRWMAPESLKDGLFTSQSDVWSFGVVLWEIATQAEQPYQGFSNDQVLQNVKAGAQLEVPKECSETLKVIMVSCWKRKPSQRMTFMQTLTSLEYFHDDNFKSVSYYHTQEAIDRRKSASDYTEMRSVEDPLLGRDTATFKPGSVSFLLSKVKSFGRGQRLSRVEESGPSEEA